MRTRLFTTTALALYVAAAGTAVLSAGQAASKTVWDGVFTTEQAARGQAQFGEHCASCHAPDLSGGEGPALVGQNFWNSWRESTVDALLGFISKNMPHSEDGTLEGKLPPRTYADVTAHILSSNGLPSGQAELNAQSIAGVQIVGKEGPSDLPANTLAQVVGCLERGGPDGWRLAKATRAVRSGSLTTAAAKDVPLGTREINLRFILTSLDRYAGHRVIAAGGLMGNGGADGINVDTVTSVATTCQ